MNDLEKIKDFKDRVNETSYNGINKELARKALVRYLDDVISRLQKILLSIEANKLLNPIFI